MLCILDHQKIPKKILDDLYLTLYFLGCYHFLNNNTCSEILIFLQVVDNIFLILKFNL